MSSPRGREQWVSDLVALRKGQGLTALRLTQSDPSLLRNLTRLDETRSLDERAQALIALIHEYLHLNSPDREYRALAHALNLDVTEPWSGEPKPVSTDQLLMARRRSFAEQEHVSEDGGKPMSDWENAAARRLVEHLESLPAPTIQPEVESEHAPTPTEPEPIKPHAVSVNASAQSPDPVEASVRTVATDGGRSRRLALVLGATVSALLIAGAAYWMGSSQGTDDAAVEVVEGVEDASSAEETREAEEAAVVQPEPTPTSLPEPTATVASEPTVTPQPEPTATPVPTATATRLPEPTVSPVVSLATIEPIAGSWNLDRSLGSTGFGLGSSSDGTPVVTAYHGSCSIGWHTRDTEYNLGQEFSIFRTNLVMDQRSGSESIYTVSFFIDDAEVPVRQFDLDLFTDEIQDIEIDVSGARRLRIESDAKLCKYGDHAIRFQGAALVR